MYRSGFWYRGTSTKTTLLETTLLRTLKLRARPYQTIEEPTPTPYRKACDNPTAFGAQKLEENKKQQEISRNKKKKRKEQRQRRHQIWHFSGGNNVRRECHQTFAQPGFRAERKRAISGHLLLIFLCLGRKRAGKKPALNPGTRVSLVIVLPHNVISTRVLSLFSFLWMLRHLCGGAWPKVYMA